MHQSVTFVNRTRPSVGVWQGHHRRDAFVERHSWEAPGNESMGIVPSALSLISWWRGNKSGRLFLNVFFLLYRSLLPGIRALCQTGRDVNSLFLHRSPRRPHPQHSSPFSRPQRLRHRRPHSTPPSPVFFSPPLVPVPGGSSDPSCTYPQCPPAST